MSARVKAEAITDAEKHKYFYLPALENMDEGNWEPVGQYGLYWTSTPTNGSVDLAFSLLFSQNKLIVHSRRRLEGDVIKVFE